MNFWQTKTLAEMSLGEWESLCDGCAKCCLHKLEDEDTGHIYFTRAACNLINLQTCRCTRYANRTHRVPDCLDLKQFDVKNFNWLPATCAYRLVANGDDLPPWHPLISGNSQSVHKAGVSIRSYAVKEKEIDGDLSEHIIEWLA